MFTAPATTAIYTLSLHDALPILRRTMRRLDLPSEASVRFSRGIHPDVLRPAAERIPRLKRTRSEEHTSELQSQFHPVRPLPLEKKTHRSAFRSPRSRRSPGRSCG